LLRGKLLNDKTIVKVQDAGAGSRRNRKDKTVNRIAKYEISPWKKCAFLSALIQEGSNCVELGTSLGITTTYLSRACPDGKIFTFEGDAKLCELAAGHHEYLSCKRLRHH